MKWILFMGAAITWTCGASALNIQLDYSYDTTNENFFGLNPTAKAAVDAAAADLGSVIVSPLAAITTDKYSGTNGTTIATWDWSLNYSDPRTGAAVTQDTFSFAANTVTFYVGMRPLTGTTLGQGGPGSSGFGISASGSPVENQWVGAVAAADASSDAAMKRGGGPIIGSYSGSLPPFGSTVANYTLNRGSMIGNLSLDNDSDNNGLVDDATTLAAYWQYDHTTAVAPGKNDLYSVALHELMHALGFGSSATWDSLHSGTTWTGSNVLALNGGSGVNMLSVDQSHIVDGYMSPTVSGGTSQEVAMDPSLTVGTRKYLTQMDLAFLRDLGYQTVPEPSTAVLLAVSIGMVGAVRRRQRS
jgi:hypothetical protein